MNNKGIENTFKKLKENKTNTTFTTKHLLGIATAVQFHSNFSDTYEKIFRDGVTSYSINYAKSYANFVVSCTIFNKDINKIVYLARKWSDYKNNYGRQIKNKH